MSDKKPGITMKDVINVKPETVAAKVPKPGITTNMVNAPVPAPRAAGPIVRGPMITTHDEAPKAAAVKPFVNGLRIVAPDGTEVEPVKVHGHVKFVNGHVKYKPITPADPDAIPARDVDDHRKDAPAPKPKAKRKPATRKKKA